MASRATPRARRRRAISSVRPVRHVLPFAVADQAVIHSEALLLAHDEERRELVRHKTAVAIKNWLAISIFLNAIALEQNDRSVGEIVDDVWPYRSRGRVGPDHADLAVLEIVK